MKQNLQIDNKMIDMDLTHLFKRADTIKQDIQEQRLVGLEAESRLQEMISELISYNDYIAQAIQALRIGQRNEEEDDKPPRDS